MNILASMIERCRNALLQKENASLGRKQNRVFKQEGWHEETLNNYLHSVHQ